MQTRFRNVAAVVVVLAMTGVTSGCLQRELKELNPCLISGVTAEISVTNVDKVDLLFIVDDSQSMLQEQVALREQFPKLVTTLTSGEQLNPDGTVRATFPAVGNLHLGVVSTDMGLVGIDGVPSCINGLGKDGRLQNTPSPDVTGSWRTLSRLGRRKTLLRSSHCSRTEITYGVLERSMFLARRPSSSPRRSPV